MQLLTHLLPEKLKDDTLLGWAPIVSSYSKEALQAEQQAFINAFKSETRRKEFMASRQLISQIVETMDLDSHQFKVHKNDLGKPWGTYYNTKFNISIAHTVGHVVCGISERRALGVDLEPAGRIVHEKLRKRIINEQEDSLLSDEPTVRIWTIKEAVVKLAGQGMRTNLNECTITSRYENNFSTTFDNDKKAKIFSFAHENNWLAVAWNAK